MPTYQVKPSSTISHEDILYQAGEVVELPSELGAFHEPNLVSLGADRFGVSAQKVAIVPDDDEDDSDEDDGSEEEITGKAFTMIVA